MILVDSNPLENFKVLYGTGAIKLTEDNEVVRVGGVKYTISDGVIYNSKVLLKEVKAMVDEGKMKKIILKHRVFRTNQIKKPALAELFD